MIRNNLWVYCHFTILNLNWEKDKDNFFKEFRYIKPTFNFNFLEWKNLSDRFIFRLFANLKKRKKKKKILNL